MRAGRPPTLAPSPEWNDIRVFLALARAGSTAAAASELGVDPTTIGRRIAALEQELGTSVFVRTSAGLRLTAAGIRIRAAAERMGQSAHELARAANPDRLGQAVTVRVATTDTLAETFVLPAVAALRASAPALRVTVSTGAPLVDLQQGDADLALRLVRPKDPRLACRKLATFEVGLYAARAFVEREGMPTRVDRQPIIAYEVAARANGRHPFLPVAVDRIDLRFTANTAALLVAAARAQIGIVALPTFVGDAQADFLRVLPEICASYTSWMVAPVASRRDPHIRLVREAILAQHDLWRRRRT